MTTFFTIEGKAARKLLNKKPFSHTYDSVAGERNDYLTVTAILADGQKVTLRDCGRAEFADNTIPCREWDCPTIREQIAELGDVSGLEIDAQSYCSWEEQYDIPIEQGDFDEGLPALLNGQSYRAYCPIRPINWSKIRRRLEDRLRKDEQAMRQCAALLGIKLW